MDYPGEKLVIKLWETLAEKGIGSLLSPWQLKREGKARIELRRQEQLMLAQTERDAEEIRSGRKRYESGESLITLPTHSSSGIITNERPNGRPEPTSYLATAQTVANTTVSIEAVRREINSAKAILAAEEFLANDPQEPPEKIVDEDWLFAWREYAGRVSNEDLQRLWGSVLAGEIKSPGRNSMRTLEFLRGLSKSEADLISLLAPFVIDKIIIRSQTKYFSDRGLSFDALVRLQEIGVIFGVEAIGLQMEYKTTKPDMFLLPLISQGKILLVKHPDKNKTLSLQIYKLTMIGHEILTLGSFACDLNYLLEVGKEIAANGQGFTVQIGDWVRATEATGNAFNLSKIGL